MYIEKLPKKLNKFIKVAGYRKMCLGEIKTIYDCNKKNNRNAFNQGGERSIKDIEERNFFFWLRWVFTVALGLPELWALECRGSQIAG